MSGESIYGLVLSADKQQLLLVLRRDLPVWVLPGGGLDPGESPENGVIREVKEETGYDVTIVRQIGEYLPVNKMTKKTYVFECSITGGKAFAGEESKYVSFFPLDQLPKRLPPPFPGWIADAKQQHGSVLKKPIEGVNYKTLFKLLFQHPFLVGRYFLTKIGIRFNDNR